MKIENTIYDNIRNYVKEHHGWGEELKDAPEYKKYQEFQEQLKEFDDKKVKISFTNNNDFLSTSGEKIGKIKVDENGRIRFYEGRRRSRYYLLDGGLFDGWYATLIPREINEI